MSDQRKPPPPPSGPSLSSRAEAQPNRPAAPLLLEPLLDGQPDACFVIGAEGRITWANQAAALISPTGSSDGLVGLDAARTLAPESPAALREALELAREDRRHVSLEVTWPRPDGAQLLVEIRCSAPSAPEDPRAAYLAVVRDRTSEHRSLDAVRASRQMLRLILDTIPVRVFWKDRDSRYLGCNRLFAQDAGLDQPEDLIGLTDYDVSFRDHAVRYRADDREVVESGVPKLGYEEPQTSPTGRPLWLRTSKVPLRGTQGQVIGVLGTYEDITEIREASLEISRRNRELHEANLELERLHQAKDEFMAMVSHELRTPLVTGIGYVELLLGGRFGSLPEPAEQRLRIAHRNLLRLSAIIQNLLSYQTIIRPKSRAALGLTSVDLSVLLGQCAEESLVRNRDVKGRLRVDLAPSLPRIRADGELLRVVVANLLDNAARHAGADATITLSAHPAEDGVMVAVSDDGRGMDPEIMSRVFEPFVKTSEEHGGSGLGLAIVSGILDAHGLGLTLESEPGRGTAFRFLVPAEDEGGAPPKRRERSITPVLGIPATARIALVATSADVRTPVRLSLLRGGFSVVEAASIDEADATLAFDQLDLCVLEVASSTDEVQAQIDWVRRLGLKCPSPTLFLLPQGNLQIEDLGDPPNRWMVIRQPLTARAVTNAVRALLHGTIDDPAGTDQG